MGLEGDNSKYDYVGGGNQRWVEAIEAVRLNSITPDGVRKWRKRFIGQSGTDPRKRKTAIRSANSFINNSKCLFAPKHLETIPKLNLPEPLPFDGVKLSGGRVVRYKSEIQPELLLAAAKSELAVSLPDGIDQRALENAKLELSKAKKSGRRKASSLVKKWNKTIYNITHAREIAESKNEQFKILLLALGAGLRRNEIDKLEWSSILWDTAVIRIQATRYFQPKTDESDADIDVDPDLLDILRRYYPHARDEFVINGNRPRPVVTYDCYRCERHYVALNRWLRSKGVSAKSPLHSLRKEFGSVICQEAGIFAASVALRHSNIRTTRDSYLDRKQRITFKIGSFLKEPTLSAVST